MLQQFLKHDDKRIDRLKKQKREIYDQPLQDSKRNKWINNKL